MCSPQEFEPRLECDSKGESVVTTEVVFWQYSPVVYYRSGYRKLENGRR
jgi:hypothetical protein